LALDFAARGASLVLSARRGDLLAETAAACEGAAPRSGDAGDVADARFVDGMAARAVRRFDGSTSS
jgi:NAD(P)-dependent dehydrogenase (short-subunit alcohol dehydrogenase family)